MFANQVEKGLDHIYLCDEQLYEVLLGWTSQPIGNARSQSRTLNITVMQLRPTVLHDGEKRWFSSTGSCDVLVTNTPMGPVDLYCIRSNL